MVTLPQLDSYTESQWEQLIEVSPISKRYRNLLEQTPKDFDQKIRLERHRHWLECAFATFLEKAHPSEICNYWSMKSQEIVMNAWSHHNLDDSGYHLVAYGKLGSNELNMSSDIDICFVKEEAFENQSQSLKGFIQCLSAITEWGFCYRVDTDLRPGGPASPLTSTIDSFIHHYGYHGEPWHRLAFIRCRALTPTSKIPLELKSFLSNYSFPRRLDYRILNSIRGLRSKIHRQDFSDIHLKLSPGGIRDIEFMVQSMQLVYGGRIEDLRTPSFQLAIENLERLGFLSKEQSLFFSNFYWDLRDLENRVQCTEDLHTYSVTPEILKKVKPGLDYESLQNQMTKSDEMISAYFSDENSTPLRPTKRMGAESISLDSQERLEKFKNSSTSLKLKGTHKKNQQQVLKNFTEAAIQQSIDPDLSITTFLDFLEAASANSSLYYILAHNVKIIEQLSWLFSFSPYSGRVLTLRPELIDSFAMGTVEINPFSNDVDNFLADLRDYKLLSHLIAISYFLKNKSIETFCDRLSLTADNIAKNILLFLKSSFPTENIDVLCLGKWGGKELGIHSDLDFIFVTQKPPQKADFQVAKRFMSLISYPDKDGNLYSTDIRLKPEEGRGPMIVSIDVLKDFLMNRAQVWQKQAYLKGRFLSNDKTFYESTKLSPQMKANFQNEITQTLGELLKKSPTLKVDIKYNYGGLIHTEFFLQKKIMENGLWTAGPSTTNFNSALKPHFGDAISSIQENYAFFRQAEQLVGICQDRSGGRFNSSSGSILKFERLLKIKNFFSVLKSRMEKQVLLLNDLDANS